MTLDAGVGGERRLLLLDACVALSSGCCDVQLLSLAAGWLLSSLLAAGSCSLGGRRLLAQTLTAGGCLRCRGGVSRRWQFFYATAGTGMGSLPLATQHNQSQGRSQLHGTFVTP